MQKKTVKYYCFSPVNDVSLFDYYCFEVCFAQIWVNEIITQLELCTSGKPLTLSISTIFCKSFFGCYNFPYNIHYVAYVYQFGVMFWQYTYLSLDNKSSFPQYKDTSVFSLVMLTFQNFKHCCSSCTGSHNSTWQYRPVCSINNEKCNA